MKGYRTTYPRLFAPIVDGVPAVQRIEIPLIQRDYAQGRQEPAVQEIRNRFLSALVGAAAGRDPVALDFVYGRVDDATLRPLDGQQRLTTLFLLHWYVASLAGVDLAGEAWTAFSYATRPSARRFCQQLAGHPLPPEAPPKDWIVDQHWYQFMWRLDPSVQGMLVTLDAIHQVVTGLGEFDPNAAWTALTGPAADAPITFYLLPLDDLVSDADLYITMNSRGKPLTAFEVFKGQFEQDIAHFGEDTVRDIEQKIDGAWSDLLWPMCGADVPDGAFMRYLTYLVKICELRDRIADDGGDLTARARRMFGPTNANAHTSLQFLLDAFDTWADAQEVSDTFDAVVTSAVPGDANHDGGRVVLHDAGISNLLERCLRVYGTDTGGEGVGEFTTRQLLQLYAFLVHRIDKTKDFTARFRTLRNLLAASDNELRRDAMPSLVADVETLITTGAIPQPTAFNTNQAEEELAKAALVAADPDVETALHRLEDHPLIRGALRAFDLDNALPSRAAAFETLFADPDLWIDLTGALLATGEYQRKLPHWSGWQLGTSDPARGAVWRELLTDSSRDAAANTRRVLAELLDAFTASGDDPQTFLRATIARWLEQQAADQSYSWRYHVVRHPELRQGAIGHYHSPGDRLSYELCVMRHKVLNSKYIDGILYGIYTEVGTNGRYADLHEWVDEPRFVGYAESARWMMLFRSAAFLRNLDHGFILAFPEEDDSRHGEFRAICAAHGDLLDATEEEMDHDQVPGVRLVIPQHDLGNGPVDSVDRILLGAALLTDLLDAGF